jgi:hypothetical protein
LSPRAGVIGAGWWQPRGLAVLIEGSLLELLGSRGIAFTSELFLAWPVAVFLQKLGLTQDAQ